MHLGKRHGYKLPFTVIPAQAGIQTTFDPAWIPDRAGARPE